MVLDPCLAGNAPCLIFTKGIPGEYKARTHNCRIQIQSQKHQMGVDVEAEYSAWSEVFPNHQS